MTNFKTEEYKKRLENLNKAYKRIPFHREISSVENTLIDQKDEIIRTFNQLTSYCSETFTSVKEETDRQIILKNIKLLKEKLVLGLNRIKLKVTFPNDDNIFLVIVDKFIQKSEMEAVEFMRLCAQTINKNYSGDPLSLVAFINSIKLLKTVVGTHNNILIQFILTKLEGKALESCPKEPKDIEEIITALELSIKPDSSKVIESKMVALKIDNSKLQDYVFEVEKLAEALQRSLIVEGISQTKAKSMAVEKTVEICKKSAKTDLVKAVIASSTFHDPKDVLAKFITETSEAKEFKVFTYHKSNRGNNRGYGNRHYVNRGNYQNNRGNYQGKNRGNHRGNYQNSNYNSNRGNYHHNRYNNSQHVRYAENISGTSVTWRAPEGTNQEHPQQNNQIIPYHQN